MSKPKNAYVSRLAQPGTLLAIIANMIVITNAPNTIKKCPISFVFFYLSKKKNPFAIIWNGLSEYMHYLSYTYLFLWAADLHYQIDLLGIKPDESCSLSYFSCNTLTLLLHTANLMVSRHKQMGNINIDYTVVVYIYVFFFL